VRKSKRGRAHLEDLLGNAEKVVRLSPADLLVLTGVSDSDAETMTALVDLLNDEGVEARGLVILGPGQDVDSIDMEELRRLDELSDEIEPGQKVVGETSLDGLTMSVKCPRCTEPLQLSITASVQDTGDRLTAGASVDSRDLELHGMVCPGIKPASE
jgi:hypothetical protein